MTLRQILEQFKSDLDGNLAGDGKCFERQEEYFNKALSSIQALIPSERHDEYALDGIDARYLRGWNACRKVMTEALK